MLAVLMTCIRLLFHELGSFFKPSLDQLTSKLADLLNAASGPSSCGTAGLSEVVVALLDVYLAAIRQQANQKKVFSLVASKLLLPLARLRSLPDPTDRRNILVELI